MNSESQCWTGAENAMPDKRRQRRVRRRLKVRYGKREMTSSGYTVDVSHEGLFVAGHPLPPLHTRIHLQLFVEGDDSVFLEGEVCRHVQVPLNLRQMMGGGFGVRLLNPHELLAPMVGTELRLKRSFATREDLRQAFASEIKHGAVTVRTDRPPPMDTEVRLSLVLEFAGATLEFDAKVVHLMTRLQGATADVVGLQLIQPKEAAAAIDPFLA